MLSNLNPKSIQISLQKETYTSGEQVYGVVDTNFPEDFDLSGYQLILKIKGKETVSFWRNAKNGEFNVKFDEKTFGEDDKAYEPVYCSESNSFLNHMYQIFSWDEQEETNSVRNKVPITFSLPAAIPSSLFFEWKNLNKECYCNIFYY